LVRASVQQAPHVLDLAHAAAYRERNEHLRGDGLDDGEDQVALVGACGDVEKGELVRTLLVVAPGDLDRVARVAQPDEFDPFDDAPAVNIQARDDALGKSHRRADQSLLFPSLSASAWAFLKSSVPW